MMTYLNALRIINSNEEKIAKNNYWLPRLYSKKVIEETKLDNEILTAQNKRLIILLPALKEEYKKAEIKRLTAELEKMKNF